MPEELPYRIACGDGPAGLLGLVEDVDHVWIDVPFGKHVDYGNAAETLRDNAFKFEPMTADLMRRTAEAIGAKTKRWALVKTSEEETHEWREALVARGMRYIRTSHWVKIDPKPQVSGDRPGSGSEPILVFHSGIGQMRWNGGGKSGIWYARPVKGDKKVHPTQTPDDLLKQIFEDFTDPGELIVDPMAGSFRSGIVAVSLGRRYRGFDIDDTHVNLAAESFKLPLFDNSPLQAELFKPKTSTVMSRMRTELDHSVIQILGGSSEEGIAKDELVSQLQKITDITPQEITRSLARLKKRQLIRREGKTSDSRYFRSSSMPSTSLSSTGDQQP